jgi:platelet-activating factor acetylhydrolase IB subunit beta/gamma
VSTSASIYRDLDRLRVSIAHSAPAIRGVLLLALFLHLGCGTGFAEACDADAVASITQARERPILKSREREITELLKQGRLDAVTFGDSIMANWPMPDLRDVLGRQTLNVGFGGDRIQDVLWHLQAFVWAEQQPKYVLILVGTNDLRFFPACAIFAGMVAIVHAVHSTFATATVILVGILPRGENFRTKAQEITDINARMAQSAPSLGFRFVDAHDALLCAQRPSCKFYLPGNLHLAPEGYDVLTRLLRLLLEHHE